MTEATLKARNKAFATRALNVADALPPSRSGDVVGRQLARSGTSAAANYRSACRAKSTADFIAKLAIVAEELDESSFWIELMVERGMLSATRLEPLRREGEELLAIIVASIKTARRRVLHEAREAVGVRTNPKSKIQNPKSTPGDA